MDKKHFNFLFTAWRKVQNFDELVINKTVSTTFINRSTL